MSVQEEVIDAMYDAYFSGDVARALRHCHPEAVFHLLTPVKVSGELSMREYFTDFLPAAIAEMSGYEILSVDRDVFEDLVISRLTSSHGSGVMVFRIVEGLVTDLWVINTKGREATGYF